MSRGGVYRSLMEAQMETEAVEISPLLATATEAVPTETDTYNGEWTGRGSQEYLQEPSIISATASDMSWFQVFGRLLQLVMPWKKALTLAFILGILRVFVLIGIGVTGALIVRQVALGEEFGALLVVLGVMAVLTPILHWAESWVSTTWRSGCWPRCASRCTKSWTPFRPRIWSAEGQGISLVW